MNVFILIMLIISLSFNVIFSTIGLSKNESKDKFDTIFALMFVFFGIANIIAIVFHCIKNL